MADQGICKFLGVAVLGGKMTLSRGVRPSRGKLYLLPETTFDRKIGTLEFTFPGGGAIQFTDAALLANTFRPYMRNRDGWRWVVQVVDRRWRWRYSSIDGVYNEAGLAPRHGSLKNIKELMELCLDAMGEVGYDTSAVPTGVRPPVVWNAARADLELAWLCDLIGFVPVLKLSTNTVAIHPLNDIAGAALPVGGEITPAASVSTWKPAVIPQNLRAQGNPTIYQSELTLSPYGLEVDGTIEPINDLTYRPASWATQWPYHFSDVAVANRDVALQTVYRWFRPTYGWNTTDITVSSFEQIELLNTTIERVEDLDGVERPMPLRVRGNFWPYSDLDANTESDTVYNGEFTVDSDRGLVIFEQPVFRILDSQIADPSLKITCAYRIREADGDGYSVYTRDKAVSLSNSITKHRILHRPDITKEVIEASVLAPGISDNETAIEAAADVYLDNVEKTYDFSAAQDVIYNGCRAVDLDGAISQIQWSAGFGVPATTRIGRFTEYDIHSMHHQQRRASERLSQMSLRMGV